MAIGKWGLWVRNAALGLVILAFIIFFGMPGGRTGPNTVAEVDGEAIDRDVFEFFRDQLASQQPELPPGTDPQVVRDAVDAQTLQMLLERYVRTHLARDLGFQVSDAEVREAILADPSFRPAGRFDRELFERYAARNFGTPREYTEQLRRDLLLLKLRRLVQSSVRVPELEARERLERDLVRVRLRYAVAASARFAEGIEVSDDEARELAGREPERVRALYDTRASELQQEEEVHARHVLFVGDDAGSRAASALERLRAGEDFAAVARELSEDEATRDEGGDLGFFPRGRMLPALEEAAFALPEGEISEPIESARGVHLIQVLEHREASEGGFEQAQLALAAELVREDRARERAKEVANEVARRLGSGADFVKTVEEAGLEVDETPPFRYFDPLVPRIGRIAGLKEAAFELRAESPVSTQVFAAGGRFYLISLLEREEPDAGTVESRLEAAQESLEREARSRVLARWSRKRREALERDGKIRLFPLYPVN